MSCIPVDGSSLLPFLGFYIHKTPVNHSLGIHTALRMDVDYVLSRHFLLYINAHSYKLNVCFKIRKLHFAFHAKGAPHPIDRVGIASR